MTLATAIRNAKNAGVIRPIARSILSPYLQSASFKGCIVFLCLVYAFDLFRCDWCGQLFVEWHRQQQSHRPHTILRSQCFPIGTHAGASLLILLRFTTFSGGRLRRSLQRQCRFALAPSGRVDYLGQRRTGRANASPIPPRRSLRCVPFSFRLAVKLSSRQILPFWIQARRCTASHKP